MMGRYGFSCTGKSHIEKNVPCQDANVIEEIYENLVFAAVADGVGSASLSQLGSQKAVSHLLDYIKLHIENANRLELKKDLMKAGFKSTLEAIGKMAQEQKQKIEEYDTTLTAVIYDGKSFIYGHSGDGGIIKLKNDGTYQEVTSAQKGEVFDEVCPLRFGSKVWVFGEGEDCCGLLLFTDGVLDIAQPYILKSEKISLYTRFLNRFLPSELFQAEVFEVRLFSKKIQQFLQDECYGIIRDDITVVALWDTKMPPNAPDEKYFLEPDWEALKKECYYRLYPHLRAKEEENNNFA